ncbi:hypothetical protein BDN72DRAFT_914014 [Pluteus cervinus]|uniref:Uncharacterized protein n=1 Tax=Pluteus cervinus TaxID=181527 RepID=A0ACD3ANP9_9AGAR|nr:hypothetical protein BDN72DRAFT_914014 [Pluteus cervinus]
MRCIRKLSFDYTTFPLPTESDNSHCLRTIYNHHPHSRFHSHPPSELYSRPKDPSHPPSHSRSCSPSFLSFSASHHTFLMANSAPARQRPLTMAGRAPARSVSGSATHVPSNAAPLRMQSAPLDTDRRPVVAKNPPSYVVEAVWENDILRARIQQLEAQVLLPKLTSSRPLGDEVPAEDSEDEVEVISKPPPTPVDDHIKAKIPEFERLAKQICCLTEAWITKTPAWYTQKPLPSSVSPPSRTGSKAERDIAIFNRVYQAIPSDLRPLLGHSVIYQVFGHHHSEFRKKAPPKMRTAVAAVYGIPSEYLEADFNCSNIPMIRHLILWPSDNPHAEEDRREWDALQEKRLKDKALAKAQEQENEESTRKASKEKEKEPVRPMPQGDGTPSEPSTEWLRKLFPPVCFPGQIHNPSQLLRDKDLASLTGGLFSGSASVSGKKGPRPKVNRELWNLIRTWPAAVALKLVLLQFLLRGDNKFIDVGLTSKTPYRKLYDHYVEFLEKLWKAEQENGVEDGVFAFYDSILFPKNVEGEEFDEEDQTDADGHGIDAYMAALTLQKRPAADKGLVGDGEQASGSGVVLETYDEDDHQTQPGAGDGGEEDIFGYLGLSRHIQNAPLSSSQPRAPQTTTVTLSTRLTGGGGSSQPTATATATATLAIVNPISPTPDVQVPPVPRPKPRRKGANAVPAASTSTTGAPLRVTRSRATKANATTS